MHYTLTELIQNDAFIDWVLHPDAESNAYWHTYAAGSAEKHRTVDRARGYVSLLAEDTGRQKPSPAQSEQMWKAIQETISPESRIQPVPSTSLSRDLALTVESAPRLWLFKRKWQLAASIAMMLAVSTAAYRQYEASSDLLASASTSGTSLATTQPESIARHNATSRPMTVLLPDGSSVVLLPGGKIQYASLDLGKKRAVTLSGKAFFEIVKDKERPFYVFTGGVTTKVLGTSFLVDAPAGTDEMNVEVKTGRVSVFMANEDEVLHDLKNSEAKATILTPNQKSVFSRANGHPIKLTPRSLESPLPIAEEVLTQSFSFDEAPIVEVFDALQSAYNVKVNFNRALMKDCTLNATLEGEPFSKKISVICAALGTTFEIRNDEVFITAKNCN